MKTIIQRIRAWLSPQSRTVYVVARAHDGSPIRDIEVYTDHDKAQQRQRALGVGDTCYAERRVDDPSFALRKPTDYRVRGVPTERYA